MYGYGYRYNSGLVVGAGGGAPFVNTYSLDFDGIDDYVSLGNSSDLELIDNFSVSFWINTTTTQNSGIIVCGDYTGSLGWKFKTASGKVVFIVGSKSIQSTTNINDASWYHVCATFNATNPSSGGREHILYVNGIAEATVQFGTATNPSYSGTIYKQIVYPGGQYFSGKIDEVSAFDYTLSPTEITSISAAPTDLTSLNPIAWYRNGDNGSYKSPQWLIPNNENKDKVSNYSLSFDGMDDYLNIANNTTIGRTQNISYSIWVNLDVTTRQYLIGNWSSSNGGTGLAVETGDVLVFQMADGTNDSFINSRVASFSTYAPINTWNHILATWDGTESKIYINGVLRNTWSPTLPYTISNHSTFWIARRGANTLNIVNGNLDEIALFDTAISIGDVWDGSGKPIDVSSVSGIVSNWKMGENATFVYNVNPDGTWTIPDEVGTNNGTSKNLMADSARVGDAPSSTNNALSINMDFVDVVPDTP